MKDRFFQAVRGICIIAVIAIHIPAPESGSDMFNYWMSFRQVINFPVAVFIFLAGYFVNPSKIGERGWMTSRLKRIGIPYLIWTVAFLGLKVVTGNVTSFAEVARAFLTGGLFHLYYLVVLLQLILFTPLLMKAVRKNSLTISFTIYFIALVWLTVRYVCEFSNISIFGTDGLGAFFLTWLCFYYWGMTAKASVVNGRDHGGSIAMGVVLLIVAVILSLFESNVLVDITGSSSFATSQIKLSSFLYATAFIKLILAAKNIPDTTRGGRMLASVGDYSFGIYLVHVVFLQAVSALTISTHTYTYLLYQALLVAATLLASYYTVRYAGLLFGSRWSKYFGLR